MAAYARDSTIRLWQLHGGYVEIAELAGSVGHDDAIFDGSRRKYNLFGNSGVGNGD